MDRRLPLRMQRNVWARAAARYEDLWREAIAPAIQGRAAGARSVSPGCHLVRTDAQAVGDGVSPATFDVVLCGLGVMYMPDPEALKREPSTRTAPWN